MRILKCLLLAGALSAPAASAAQELSTSGPFAACVRPGRTTARKTTPADSAEASIRATFQDAVRQGAREAGIPDPRGLVALVRTGRDEPYDLRNYRGTVPDSVVGRAVNGVAARLEEWPWPRPMRLMVRLDSIPPDSVNCRARERRPVLENRAAISAFLQAMANEILASSATPAIGNEARLMMLVSRDGSVAYAYVDRPSRNPRLDDVAQSLGARARFKPAALYGVPIDLWVGLPIRLRVDSGTRGTGFSTRPRP